MEKIYERMMDIYSDDIQKAYIDHKQYVRTDFERFRLGLKENGLVNSRITAKEKWESAILDGVLYTSGNKKMGAIDVEQLLKRTGQLAIYKYKYIFSNPTESAQEGSE